MKTDKQPYTRTEVEIRTFRGKQKKSKESVTFHLDHVFGDQCRLEQKMAQPIIFRSIENPYPMYVRGSEPDTVIITLHISPKPRKLTREQIRQQKRDEKARLKRAAEECEYGYEEMTP
jgi:hypothetical protein